jgi:hypothetical protein
MSSPLVDLGAPPTPIAEGRGTVIRPLSGGSILTPEFEATTEAILAYVEDREEPFWSWIEETVALCPCEASTKKPSAAGRTRKSVSGLPRETVWKLLTAPIMESRERAN